MNTWEISERFGALERRYHARDKSLALAANDALASGSYDAYDELVSQANVENNEDLDEALRLLRALFQKLDHQGGWRSPSDPAGEDEIP